MDTNLIYRKTAKGQQEMAARSNELPARVRTLLVMVDGKCTGADLLAKGKAFGDPVAFIEQLLAGGFIEAAAPPAAPAPVAAPAIAAPAPAAAAGTDASLKELMRFASHMVIDRLGPTADVLTIKLEKSRTAAELGDALSACRDAIQAVAGKRKAEEFWTAVSARM